MELTNGQVLWWSNDEEGFTEWGIKTFALFNGEPYLEDGSWGCSQMDDSTCIATMTLPMVKFLFHDLVIDPGTVIQVIVKDGRIEKL